MEICAHPGKSVRCENIAIPGSMHCFEHNSEAAKLYLKYKNSSTKLKKYNHDAILLTGSINLLLKYYSLLQQTHTGRLNYKKYSLVSECQDEGHEHQITKLKRLLEETEKVLSQRFQEETQTRTIKNSESNESSSVEEEYIEENIPAIIQKNILDRKALEDETEKVLDRYVKELQEFKVEKMKIEKYKLENFIFKEVDKLTPFFNSYKTQHPFNLGNLSICVSNIVLKLRKLGLLENISVRISGGNIVKPYDIDTVIATRYANNYSLDELKYIYKSLLFNSDIIVHLLTDLRVFANTYQTYEVLIWIYKIERNEQNQLYLIPLKKAKKPRRIAGKHYENAIMI